jgi:MFS family permease
MADVATQRGPEAGVSEPSELRALPVGELVGRLTDQVSTLVRDEMQLARLELRDKAKRAGVGAGLLGAGAAAALLAGGALVAAAILALALVLPGWAAALVIGGAVALVAGLLALAGRLQVKRATPLAPTEAVDGLTRDVKVVKEHGRS